MFLDSKGPLPIKTITPWRHLLTSTAVIAIVINGYAERTVQFFIGLYLPTYFADAFGIQVKTTGILTALPFLGQIAGTM